MTEHVLQSSYSDFIQPFVIDRSVIRGRFVRLEASLNQIIKAHGYPRHLSHLLAEQLLITALLSATLTGKGILTVHAKGNGVVRSVVTDSLAGGVLRGYADSDLARYKAQFGKSRKTPSLSALMGTGYLAVTLDPDSVNERYQSVVALDSEALANTFRGYFSQSQQAEVVLHLYVQLPTKQYSSWCAAGMVIERMPLEGGSEHELTPEEQEQLWQRSRMFMQTLKREEMLDNRITPQNLLYRLFNEDGVWVTKLQPVTAGCRCSRERVVSALSTVPKQELLDALIRGVLKVHCQFCHKTERFSRADIEALGAHSQ